MLEINKGQDKIALSHSKRLPEKFSFQSCSFSVPQMMGLEFFEPESFWVMVKSPESSVCKHCAIQKCCKLPWPLCQRLFLVLICGLVTFLSCPLKHSLPLASWQDDFRGFQCWRSPWFWAGLSFLYVCTLSLEISFTPLAWNHIYAFGSQTSISSPDYLLALSICMSHRHMELKAPTKIITLTSRQSTDIPRGQVRNTGLILYCYLPLPRTDSPAPSVLSSKYPLNLPTSVHLYCQHTIQHHSPAVGIASESVTSSHLLLLPSL